MDSWQAPGSEWDEYLRVALEAAEEGARVLRDFAGKIGTGQIDRKRAFDYVTQADVQSENAIIARISRSFPDHSIFAEESEKGEGTFRWLIDPLDGTTNFVHGYPVYAVSVALEYRGKVVVGVVLDVPRGDCYYAVRGAGAYCNGRRLTVSALEEPGLGILTTGFPFRAKEHIDHYLASFRKLFLIFSDVRRAGAVALDLAHLASGHCEGFWEIGLSPWDIAAGSLLVEEAGGKVTDFGGGDQYIWTGNIVASNGLLHPIILDAVRSVFAGIIDK
ncbi:MAG: inositol monophosphatase [candidate division KSB1 bacterium]|nr:inositol monophosphatase [candidate division KSB1 bacterium]